MNRYDFVYLFDVKDANPNGDPDAGNLPRVDPETGEGLVTDVCLKRKIRNYAAIRGQRIYVAEGTVMNTTNREAYDAVGEKPVSKKLPKDAKKAVMLTEFMCKNFYDIRTFGAVMSNEVNCGQVRGPIQISFARSVHSVVSLEHTIAVCAARKEDKPIEEQTGIQGRKFTIPYGLYRAHGFVNPLLAEKTGFGEDDLDLLWEALQNAFQFDQSAARPAGSMAARKLLVFKHRDALGNAPSHTLLESVQTHLKDPSKPPRAFTDYEVKVEGTLPEGVELIEKI
jgi:CRISPR-associated protein Csd2